jgi:hypothetical protein
LGIYSQRIGDELGGQLGGVWKNRVIDERFQNEKQHNVLRKKNDIPPS